MSDNEDSRSKSEQAADENKEEEQEQQEQQDGKHDEHEAQGDEQETFRDSPTSVTSPTAWQAIFSPHHNAYYFYNTETQETTWSNPLQPSPDPSTDTTAQPSSEPEPQSEAQPTASTSTTSTSSYTALQAAALAAGIDPSLAYLDPTLSSLPTTSTSTLPTLASTLPTFTAKFNARTGQFTRPDARDPTHLSEYDRAKRMSEFYFDVGAWEKELAERNAGAGAEGEEGEGEGGKKRKRPSKKDLVCAFLKSSGGDTDLSFLGEYRNGSRSRKSRRRLRRRLGCEHSIDYGEASPLFELHRVSCTRRI